MTEKKISYALSKIKSCKENGFGMEALLRTYQLNIEIMRFLHRATAPSSELKDKKVKTLLKGFMNELDSQPEFKSIIHKRSLKSLKPWLVKMDEYFHQLKTGANPSPKSLQSESEKIFGLLK